jgi:lysophospholipid acyltransferase (LPLAT)-like uncharacterized protein
MKTKFREAYNNFKWVLVGIIGKLMIDILFFSTKIETVDFDKVSAHFSSKKFILAFWHSRILLVGYLYKGWGGAILVSSSKDGEFIARVLQRQGHETIRGSSSRGGLRALAKQIKCLKEKVRPGVIIPDGPRGPRFKVQPGIITLAKKTGYPVVPVSYSAKKIKIFKSWDRFILPYPFTTCRLMYGDPVCVASNADKDEENRCKNRLEKELNRITRDVDSYFGHVIR